MLSVISRVVDIAVAVMGASLGAALSAGTFVWLDDVERTMLGFSCVLMIMTFPSFGIYQSWRGKPVYDLLLRVTFAWLLVESAGVLLTFSIHRADLLSRLWLVYWAACTVGLLIVTKTLIYTALKFLRREGFNQKTVAIVGSAPYANFLIEQMRGRPDAGFSPVCVFDLGDDPDAKSRAMEGDTLAGVRIERDFSSLAGQVRKRGIRELWLALPISQEQTIHRIVSEFRDDFVNVRFIPDVRSLALFESGVTDLLGVPAINLVASPLSPSAMLQKELFDRAFALAALVAVAPLMIGVALAIKLTSRGPVFFRQRRKGADGRVFTIYKFRSMRMHTEQAGVLHQATRNDPRVTRVGAFLRRTSLDELPQFYNVLRGDMSVVGPRPHALEHDDLYQKVVSGYIHRYRIKPGITGWAQVNGFRGETDRIEKMEGRVAHDLYYLGNWSFGLDMRIIAATIFKGLRHTNAY